MASTVQRERWLRELALVSAETTRSVAAGGQGLANPDRAALERQAARILDDPDAHALTNRLRALI